MCLSSFSGNGLLSQLHLECAVLIKARTKREFSSLKAFCSCKSSLAVWSFTVCMVGAMPPEPYPCHHTRHLQCYLLWYQALQLSLNQLLKIIWLPGGRRRLWFTQILPVFRPTSSHLGSCLPPSSPKSKLSSTSLAAELSLWQSPQKVPSSQGMPCPETSMTFMRGRALPQAEFSPAQTPRRLEAQRSMASRELRAMPRKEGLSFMQSSSGSGPAVELLGSLRREGLSGTLALRWLTRDRNSRRLLLPPLPLPLRRSRLIRGLGMATDGGLGEAGACHRLL